MEYTLAPFVYHPPGEKETRMSVTVKVLTDGPLIVTGECKVEDAQGNPIPSKPGDSVALCRCGASANKPFCDGGHKRIGFKS
jgi:Iron-binding zinc finger CDGSH type